MKLELSPTHPMHKGLCRGHGGSMWWVWLIGYDCWCSQICSHLRSHLSRCERRCEKSPDTHIPKQPSTIHESGVSLGIMQTTWDNVTALFIDNLPFTPVFTVLY